MIYIADVFTNVGLSIILMDLNIKNLSISTNLNKDLKKIQSLADIRGVNIYFTEKFKFVSYEILPHIPPFKQDSFSTENFDFITTHLM